MSAIDDGPLAQRYLEILSAFRSRDLARAQRFVSPAIAVTFTGRNRFSGTYRGIEEVLGFIATVQRYVEGSASQILEVRAEEHAVRARVSLLCRDNGGAFAGSA